MTPTTQRDAEVLLQAFAEPTRLRILALLLPGETCVCDLTEALAVPQPTVSRHLACLRRAGLVQARKDGLWSWYSLTPAQSRVHQTLLACLASCREEMPELAANDVRCCELRQGRHCC